MKYRVVPLDVDNDKHILALLKWNNDDELYHLTVPKKHNDKREEYTFDLLKKRYRERLNNTSGVYIVLDGDKPVGTYSLCMNPKQIIKKIDGTSWLALIIGEKEYWGTGAAKFAMNSFEEKSVAKGAVRIELGTFEFNYRAQAFYKKMGFVEFCRVGKFTYWNGKYWDDVRMEKYL